MKSSVERIKAELRVLVEEGTAILTGEIEAHGKKQPAKASPIIARYQNWYTRALPIVRQLIPDRLTEFQEQYRLEKRKQVDALTYTVSDYLLGMKATHDFMNQEVFDSFETFVVRFYRQVSILESAQARIDSILADITAVLKADLFDTELEKGKELLRKGHLRAAGTVAGVVLESHLSTVCENHFVKLTKKNPVISDFNEALKKQEVYDIPTWRLIQRLGDIRNLCVHAKEREPSREEVDELLAGVEKVVKTVF